MLSRSLFTRTAFLRALVPQTRLRFFSSSLASRLPRTSQFLQSSTLQSLTVQPRSTPSALALTQIRGMKTRSSVKRLCEGCKVGDRNHQQHICLTRLGRPAQEPSLYHLRQKPQTQTATGEVILLVEATTTAGRLYLHPCPPDAE